MAADKKQRQEYARALAAQRRKLAALERESAQRFAKMATDLSRQIEREVRYSYDQEQAQRNLARALADLQRRAKEKTDQAWPELERAMQGIFKRAGSEGIDATDEILHGLLGEKSPLGLRTDLHKVQLMADFSADLIQNVKADMLRKINTSLRLGVVGGKSASGLITDMARFMPVKGTRFASVAGGPLIRSEAIVRTELHRVNNLAQMSRAEQYAADGVDVIKKWQHTGTGGAGYSPRLGHIAMDKQERKLDKRFQNPLTSKKLLFPHDPAADASETVNCGCRNVITTGAFRDLFADMLEESA